MAAKCNITTTVLEQLNRVLWGLDCKGIDNEALYENYAEYLACPTVNISICHPDNCDNPSTVTTDCSGFEITKISVQQVTVHQGDSDVIAYKFYIDPADLNGASPYTYVWSYDPARWTVATVIGSVGEITLIYNYSFPTDMTTTISVTITDTTGCIAEKSCIFKESPMSLNCNSGYVDCPSDIELVVTPDFIPEGLLSIEFTWDREAGDIMNLAGKINGTFSVIDWGDGTINNFLTHNYLITGSFTVRIYDSNSTIFLLYNKFGASLYKLTHITALPDTLEILNVGNNYLQNDTFVVDFVNLPNLTMLLMYKNLLTIPFNIHENVLLTEVNFQDNSLAGEFNISDNTALIKVELDRNQLTTIPITSLTSVSLFQATENNLTSYEVNNVLVGLSTNPITDGICLLDSQTPSAPPTGTGISSKALLITNGWTVITD